MIESYITVRNQASDEVTIQKSRFIGHAAPCASEEEAQAFLQSLRDRYRDARHHCYAYIIGQNSGIMRYSDDGEPGGTAGLPMMNVLKGASVVDCCVVVVRYFGGVLLGTGGLVRAYTEGCKIALNAAGLVRMERTSVFLCQVPYPAWDSLQHALRTLPARLGDVEYAEAIRFSLFSRTADTPKVLESLQNTTARTLQVLEEEERFDPWEL